jgi:hypothetical protein
MRVALLLLPLALLVFLDRYQSLRKLDETYVRRALLEPAPIRAAANEPDGDAAETTNRITEGVVISLRNGCAGETILVAICYLNGEGMWITRGWYELRPHELEKNIGRAYGSPIYFYGKAGQSRWRGRNDELNRLVPIKEKADFVAEVGKLDGEGVSSVSFFGRTLGDGASIYEQLFTCGE